MKLANTRSDQRIEKKKKIGRKIYRSVDAESFRMLENLYLLPFKASSAVSSR